MKVNITSRDFKFFMLGVFAMLIFMVINDWENAKAGFLGNPPIENVQK
jgi:hypothetical protein